MIVWSEQVECNLLHSIGEEDLLGVGELKMEELDSNFKERSNLSHFSQSSVKEGIHPLLLEELVEMEVMDSYEI